MLQFHDVCNQYGNIVDSFTMNNILKSGYWPQSPLNFSYLFPKEVFKIWDQFRKQMPGSSSSAFLETLNFSRIQGALSVMHAKGHSIECQVILKIYNYCPKKQEIYFYYLKSPIKTAYFRYSGMGSGLMELDDQLVRNAS